MQPVTIPFFHVDAFTDRPFAGNPAAVCLLDSPRDTEWMRRVAAEFGVSETAFVVRQEGGFGLRWFTPAVEVDLCGHATLATAHVLWENHRLAAATVARFLTRSGWLAASCEGGWVTLDFPALAIVAGPIPEPFVRALGVEPCFTGMCVARVVIQVEKEATVRDLRPDFALLRSVPGRALMVTAAADPASGYDFVSRYFAPWVGVDEDPVTGAAHCGLGPFWGARLRKTALSAYQASPRGGALRIGLAGDRVRLGGQAVTVVSGQFHA
jgi:PhzF family phenazine biosynthesis protein